MYGPGQQYPQGGQPQQPHGAPQPPYGAPPQYGQPQPQVPPQYGAPQPQQQAPYGYPPQQPAPGAPYGAPQQPYGAPGYPPAPPAAKNRTGLVIGLVVGALVLGGGGFGLYKLLGAADDAAPGTYKIGAPQNLPGGYVLSKTDEDKVSESEAAKDGMGANLTEVSTTYKGGDGGADTTSLSINGEYGDVASPDVVMEKIKTKANEPSSSGKAPQWQTPLRDFSAKDPHDSKAKLACGVMQVSSKAAAVCYWADHSTHGAIVFRNTLTVDEAAEKARGLRDATLVKK